MRSSFMNRENIKRWIVFSMLAVLAMLSWGCSTSAPEISALAPAFTASTLDGETITLDELRGKPVVLNFWATWCGACRYQMPFLQAAFEEKGHDMEFIGINLRESSDKVRQVVEYEGVGYTIVLDGDGAVANSYNVRPIPATFFIDEQWVIKYTQIGAFRSQAELMAVLDDYL
jgi:cytochrome c biogenesis protein CcmG/thiol:disulfide interchange protein DsbE